MQMKTVKNVQLNVNLALQVLQNVLLVKEKIDQFKLLTVTVKMDILIKDNQIVYNVIINVKLALPQALLV